jgi:hypothetical protein
MDHFMAHAKVRLRKYGNPINGAIRVGLSPGAGFGSSDEEATT